jgi:hypothetical protein
MDLTSHLGAQGGVNQLMPRDGALARKLRGNDAGSEMRVIVRLDDNLCARETGGDKGLNFGGIHGTSLLKNCGDKVADDSTVGDTRACAKGSLRGHPVPQA